MKILVVGAMDVEIKYIRDYLSKNNVEIKEEIYNGYHFYLSKIDKHDVILVRSGVGRVNSAVLLTTAVNNFKFDKVINIGLAGGLPGSKIDDIIVGENTIYGDVDVTTFENKYVYGQMSGCPRCFEGDVELINEIKKEKHDYLYYGGICSCDKFTTSIVDANNLIDKHFKDLNILAFDMESASFAQCCYLFKIPFLAIRFISDIIGSDDQEEVFFNNELAIATFDRNNMFVIDLIKRL